MNRIVTYDAPPGAVLNDDYEVMARTQGGEWRRVSVYEVRVDMHEVRRSSMASFDMEGIVEVAVTPRRGAPRDVVVRPLDAAVLPEIDGCTIRLTLDRPRKLSVECDGDRFGNLHLFANPVESDAPEPDAPGVTVIRPGIHRVPDLLKGASVADTLYFAPGMHYVEETLLKIPSGKTVYLAGGAVLVGSLVCEHVRDVAIRGRGLVYLADFHRFSAFRGVRVVFSENVSIEGITVVDPPHYSIFIGSSRRIAIRNFKAFSTRGWSDGIDMMASRDIEIDDVFMRNSDDCIAVYGSRWDYFGDTRNVTVRHSVLWADVAHPINIGTHGDHHRDGDVIEGLRFEHIDILEHHEPQPNYWGAMSINAGDRNTVRDVTFKDVRVEAIETGQLFDIRVVHNKDYNPVPGSRIANVSFRDIHYAGGSPNPSRIHGFDEERIVDGVTFDNVRIAGERLDRLEHPMLDINGYARSITFDDQAETRRR